VVGPDYIIGAEDTLHVSVWKEPDLSETLPVRPDGKISMPLLDDVNAAGLTPMQLADSITAGSRSSWRTRGHGRGDRDEQPENLCAGGSDPYRNHAPAAQYDGVAGTGQRRFYAVRQYQGHLRVAYRQREAAEIPVNYKALLKGASIIRSRPETGDTIVVP